MIMNISEIFLAAVWAMIMSFPSLLIAVCNVKVPILTRELINPIDIPALIISFTMIGLGSLNSSF